MARLLSWTVACAVGEALGLTLSGAVAAIVVPFLGEDVGPGVHWAVMLGAGAIEGAALGAVQAAGLRRWQIHPSLPVWIAASAVGMSVSWAIGTAVGGAFAENDTDALVPFAIASGVVIGGVLGTGQALLLLRHPRRARVWVSTNLVAWPLAMIASYVGAAALPPADYGPTALALGLVTGSVMGAIVGAATGVGLMLTEKKPAPSSTAG